MDKAIYENLVHEFQHLESILSFFSKGSLKKVYWDSPKQEFIPETQEEKEELKVVSMQWTKSYPKRSRFLSKDTFVEIMENRNKYADLIISQAFFREGINDYDSFRYINAFYNFYFVIEDLYGGGKCQNRDVERELKKSDEFRSHVKWMIENIQNVNKYHFTQNVTEQHFTQNNKRHYDNIFQYLKIFRKNFDVDGIIFIIVRIRGQLHHYSEKSTQIKGTPFNHGEFESFAYLVMGIAAMALEHKKSLINNQVNKSL